MHNTRDSFSSKEFVGNGIVYLKTKNNTKVFDPKSILKTWENEVFQGKIRINLEIVGRKLREKLIKKTYLSVRPH